MNGADDGGEQLGDPERLAHVRGTAQARGGSASLRGADGRDEDDGHVRVPRPEDLQQLDTLGARNAIVQDDRRRPGSRNAGQRRLEIAGLLALEPGGPEEVPEEAPRLGITIDDQETRGRKRLPVSGIVHETLPLEK